VHSPFSNRAAGLLLLTALTGLPVLGSVSIYMPPEELARRAELVVEATVSRTASGLDPRSGRLATYVDLEVTFVHRGPAELARLTLREAGGHYGDRGHHIDAVPDYRVGQRVLVFLEPARDGALRTAGLFFGKFDLREGAAVRDLQGQGRIVGGPGPVSESFELHDMTALAAAPSRLRAGSTGPASWHAAPPETDRLLWDDVSEVSDALAASGEDAGLQELALSSSAEAQPHFAPLSATAPTRWTQSDSGTPVAVHVDPTGNPLGGDLAAAVEIARALDAWNGVPESRLELTLGNTTYDYPANHASSPASDYTGVNVVLFDDPYDDISDPSNCSGVLAVGGYWYSGSPGAPVNNVSFYSSIQLYTIFNNDFECFLADPDNLAEVAAHEIGHGIGFGHSQAFDSIMRSSAYGGRGARLGDDDRDAAHCHYPHSLQLNSPAPGESWTAGTVEPVSWSLSTESGVDPGTVDLEYSVDNGATWVALALDTPNDGHHDCLVPDVVAPAVLLRLRRPNRGAPISPYPSACTSNTSQTPLAIVAPVSVAGEVPDGAQGTPLTLARNGATLQLSWGASCSADAADYAVYSGDLAQLRQGGWDHAPVTCSTGATGTALAPAAGDRYYLVAPIADGSEGSLGAGSGNKSMLRPAAASACRPRENDSVCY